MDYLPNSFVNCDKKRTGYYRLTESDTYRPRDRYDSVGRQHFTYKQQYDTQYMYYDGTDRYNYRYNTARPVRQSDLTDRHDTARPVRQSDLIDRHNTPRPVRQSDLTDRHNTARPVRQSDLTDRHENGKLDRHDINRRPYQHRREDRRCRGDERVSRSRDTSDERAEQSVTCTIPTPPADNEWLVLDVWDQEETIETIFYPELWSTQHHISRCCL